MRIAVLGRPVDAARLRRVAGQFTRFAVAGSIGAAVDFGTYLALTRIVGFVLMMANPVSVLLAMVCVFFLNKCWTFRDRRAHVLARQGIGFFSLYGVTYVLNLILTWFFATRVPLLQAHFGSRADIVAKVIAIGIILFVNFLGIKLLVFHSSSRRSYGPVATTSDVQVRSM